jgi:YbgC/YbaW family acyl-CoA thioester hydrolase
MSGLSNGPVSECRIKRRVYFYETDLAGIVHFSCYFRYMEEAEHALWRRAGLSIAPRGAEIGFPRVSASFDYVRPLRFEDEFEAWIRIAGITQTSMSYTCELTSGSLPIAKGSLAIACVSKKPLEPLRPIPIPSQIASRFEIYREEI